MFSILGHGSKLCDGIPRHELMRGGGLSLFGSMTLPQLLEAQGREQGSARARAPGPSKSVILFNLLAGPSHIDTFGMKPDAPLAHASPLGLVPGWSSRCSATSINPH